MRTEHISWEKQKCKGHEQITILQNLVNEVIERY
jgi:hypothetical protein